MRRVLALLLLLALSPILLVIGILIKLTSRGEIIYCQDRSGKGNKLFCMYKFRSMVDKADENLPDWDDTFKLDNDPRVTTVGRFLRATKLDELLQLWNIVKGEMTFVGPRPLPEYHLCIFDDNFKLKRSQVLPGITGFWQVFNETGKPEEFVILDTQYLANKSILFDLKIIYLTFRKVLNALVYSRYTLRPRENYKDDGPCKHFSSAI